MKRLGIVAAFLVVTFAIYISVFSTTVRYRLTLEADVDGQPKTGVGVIEVSYSKNNDPISSAEFSIGIRGEAVVLDLGSRGLLFALLKEDTDSRSGPEYILLRAFDFSGGALPRPVVNGLTQVQHLSGKRELPLTSLPLLVRFRDLNDPLTVERVDPLDLQKSFGPGVQLTRATLEIVPAGIWPFSWLGITGEPLTDSLEKKLMWLKGTKGGNLDGKFAVGGPALSNALFGGNFKTGLYPTNWR